MYKIGEFSTITGMTTTALRYYDDKKKFYHLHHAMQKLVIDIMMKRT